MVKKILLSILCLHTCLFSNLYSETKAYFNSDCEKALISSINKAKSNIKVAIFTFTRFTIARALLAANKRGVKVEIILDKKQAKSEYGVKILDVLENGSISTILFDTNDDRVHMHHKFCIIDRKSVITGNFIKGSTLLF